MAASPVALPYAGRSTRLVGQCVDGIIGAVPFGVAMLVMTIVPPAGVLLSPLAWIWAGFYYLFADGFSGGQSYAKRWLGIHVVDARTGRPCSFGQSLIRNFLLAILGPIDWLFIFGDQHQRLGDKAAGTIVVAD